MTHLCPGNRPLCVMMKRVQVAVSVSEFASGRYWVINKRRLSRGCRTAKTYGSALCTILICQTHHKLHTLHHQVSTNQTDAGRRRWSTTSAAAAAASFCLWGTGPYRRVKVISAKTGTRPTTVHTHTLDARTPTRTHRPRRTPTYD